MGDWVHCNKCFLQPIPSCKLKFHLTSCGHIFCEKCLSTGKHSECFVCHTQCNTITLTANLSPNIEEFFSDPNDLLQRYIKVRDFQKGHREKLFAHLSKELQIVQSKYAQAKECIKKANRTQSALEKDNQRLRNFLKGSITSPHPGAPPHSGYASEHNTHTPTLTSRSYVSTANSANSIIRGETGKSCSRSSNSGWQVNQPTKEHSQKHKYSSAVPQSQITASRLTLPKPNQYRSTQHEFNTPSQNSSFVNGLSTPMSSGITMSGGNRLLCNSFNMSGLSLHSKASLPGRK